MEVLIVLIIFLIPILFGVIYYYVKQNVAAREMEHMLKSVNVSMSKIVWARNGKKSDKKPLLVSVHGAKILKVYHNSGINLNETIDVENQTSFLFNPYEDIKFYIDAEDSENFVIEVKEETKNGYHAKFILKNQNKYNHNMNISLRPEAAEISLYNYYIEEFDDNTHVVPAKFYNKEYETVKYDWVFAHIIKLHNFVLAYADILVPKYEQHVYINEWGEDVVEEPFWQTVDKLLDKFYDVYSPYDLKEYEKLQKIAIHPYFPSQPLDGESEVYKVVFLKNKNENAGDVDFITNVVIDKNKSNIQIRYYQASEHTDGIEWTPKTRTYYCDGGIVLGCVSVLSELNKINNKRIQKEISPLNYEKQIMILLKRLGFNAKNTKASGDQGADVLADKNGIKFAIQCKMYSKPVGNKAVQEVNAARDYYKCDFAVVVTNSSYTPAARKAAKACGVILLHDSQLDKLEEFI